SKRTKVPSPFRAGRGRAPSCASSCRCPRGAEARKVSGRILIVEDEQAMVLALKGLLTREGYQVETAARGDEALSRIETGRFHIVITAYGSEKTAVRAMKLGAVDYLPKPFDNDELRAVVRRVMDTQLLRRDHRRLLEEVSGV